MVWGKPLIFFLLTNPLYCDDFPQNADEITYEWLVRTGSKTAYTEHIPHFNVIFAAHKIHTFLEFGMGFSTKFFLDHCDKVISVEFIVDTYDPDGWMKHCLRLFRNCAHWLPIAYFSNYRSDTNWAPHKFLATKTFSDACTYQCRTHQDYSLINDSYLKELNSFIEGLVKEDFVDIAFVDAGIYLRGDLVQLLFGKVPIIVAHDCRRPLPLKEDPYGYSRVKTPEDYEEICISSGPHTTLWIQKNEKLATFTDVMRRYAAIYR